MIKQLIFVFILFIYGFSFSQINPNKIKKEKTLEMMSDGSISNRVGNSRLDSLANRDEFKVQLSEETTYKDYKIIRFSNDTVYVDTTLTIKKHHKFNFIRKDDFELLPFHNQGQTFNKLAYNFQKVDLYPSFGARAKFFNFDKVSDVNYFNVATPFTELMYRGGLEQGQVLDALITLNLNQRQNISLKYKGLRSLGKYRHSLSSHGNMQFTYTYNSKNEKYQLQSHLTAQELFNQENGGLIAQSVVHFVNDDDDFSDRGRLETHFVDADNILRANRYFINHTYDFLSKKDSVSTKYKLKLGHIFKYNTKHYQFNQTVDNNYFGDAFTSEIRDKRHLEETYNQLNIAFKSDKIFGNLNFFIENYNYSYRFKNVVFLNNQIVPQGINGNVSSVGATWNTYYKGITIDVKGATTAAGNLNGNYFKASASYKKDSLFVLKGTLLNNSKSPNFNFLLNQSDYKAYNWQNNYFKNELTRTLLFELKSNKLLDASAQITQLDNYTHFRDTLGIGQTKPEQFSGTINYLKLKASKSVNYKRFTIENTIMYQKVANGSEVFRVPELVTRNTLYYSNSIFKKKPMYIQTGVTFKYFTEYYANAYNPLLSEFYLQSEIKIGNYPVVDVFINARVRSMRLFLRAEHINTLFSNKKSFFSAPKYPYRDYSLRFGVVWNFFI